MPRYDTPEVKVAVASKESHKVYVDIPKEDMFEMIHPDIIVNGINYQPGKHYVEPELGGEITRLVTAFNKGQIRLLRPKMDKVAMDAINRSGQRISGGTFVDPNSPEFS